MIYIELFLCFVQIGLFSIGGGYAAMPLIREQVVEMRGWLTMTQFGDIMTISEMTPGPIAINSATFVGIQVAGIPGAIASTLGCIFPSLIIVLGLAFVYYRFKNLNIVQGVLAGLRPAVIAMIASAGISLILMSFWGGQDLSCIRKIPDLVAVFLFAAGLFVLRKWKVSPICVMGGCGLVGLILYSII